MDRRACCQGWMHSVPQQSGETGPPGGGAAPAPWRGVPSDGPPTGTAAIRLRGLEEEAQNELPSHILFKFPLQIGVGLAAGKHFSSHRCQQQKVSELK